MLFTQAAESTRLEVCPEMLAILTGYALREYERNPALVLLMDRSLGDEWVVRLATILPKCRGLKVLHLRGNEISDAGVIALAAVLPGCRELEALDLTANNFGAEGVRVLKDVLPKCEALKTVRLGNNNIPAEDIAEINQILKDKVMRKASREFLALVRSKARENIPHDELLVIAETMGVPDKIARDIIAASVP